MRKVSFRKVDVDGFNIFYREAGRDAPVLLLLHGFPTASHMFRDLIPQLVDQFRLIAPDLPGFGQSDMPERTKFNYTFDNISGIIDRFTEVIGLGRFAIYVFDYGAPTGFRLAMRHPGRITSIVSQNGNAYVEGLSDGWDPIRAYWQEPSEANRAVLRALLTPETTYWQYTHGVADASAVSPDGNSLDNFYLARPGADEVQLDLFGDYKSNVALYPEFQTISAGTSRRFWRFGERTTPSSCRRVRRRSSATFQTRKCVSSTPGTLRSRRTVTRSPRRSAISSRPDHPRKIAMPRSCWRISAASTASSISRQALQVLLEDILSRLRQETRT
jgi:pimeloyl-ACP methyl ester carboxylesterase